MNYLVCQHCGKQYTAKRSDSKYCSPACTQAFYRREQRDSSADVSVLDWRNDEVSARYAKILIQKVPYLNAYIGGHYHKHGAIATKELLEALWRLYIFISPDSNKANLTQREYYEIWEHEVDKNGGFVHFWHPLFRSGKSKDWLKTMYKSYDVDLKDVRLNDGIPMPI